MKYITCKDGTRVYLSEEKKKIAIKYKWCTERSRNGNITIVTYINGGKKNFSEIVFGVNTKTHGIYHKNKKYFDFTDDNIVIVTRSELGHLTGGRKNKKSKYMGVYETKNSKKWSVKIVKDKKQIFGGNYMFEYEAGLMADYITIKHLGNMVHLNFPMLGREQLEKLYQLILDKYGSTASSRRSKSFQGLRRKKYINRKLPVGVYYVKDRNVYLSRINFMDKVYRMKKCKDENEAGLLYDEKAVELYGSYAKLNNPIKFIDKVKETFIKYTGIENPS